MATRTNPSIFGSELRRWRTIRRFSQEELALRSDVSQRHLSFLENGRSRPSSEMVTHLAIALDIPLRARNGLLTAAGFAPSYTDEALDGERMAELRSSLERMLDAHHPFPAYVVNRRWDLELANPAALTLMSMLLDDDALAEVGGNVLKLLLHPSGLRPLVENWDRVAAVLLGRLRSECDHDPTDLELRDVLEDVLDYEGIAELPTDVGYPVASDLLTEIDIALDGRRLRFYTAIMLLSDAVDITVSELRLETLLPADADTHAALAELVGEHP
ncbi:MAG: helix-turn-helix transcriptional regulator [Acidimicrobiia bacterium]|nr:helix-turn-helix transcriptional regulator [Acidimicrobiia bacterium]